MLHRSLYMNNTIHARFFELPTVVELSNTRLQYTTGAAATTFLVKAPGKYKHENKLCNLA